MATAANLRAALIRSMYSINLWPNLAALLGEAFKGDFTELVNTTMPVVSPTSVGQPDYSTYATEVIVVYISVLLLYAVMVMFLGLGIVCRCQGVLKRSSASDERRNHGPRPQGSHPVFTEDRRAVMVCFSMPHMGTGGLASRAESIQRQVRAEG